MTIELVRKTTAIYGQEYYYVKANSNMLTETWTTDPDEAQKQFEKTVEKARIFPEDKYETIQTVEL